MKEHSNNSTTITHLPFAVPTKSISCEGISEVGLQKKNNNKYGAIAVYRFRLPIHLVPKIDAARICHLPTADWSVQNKSAESARQMESGDGYSYCLVFVIDFCRPSSVDRLNIP